MIKAVLDSTVLVSAFLSRTGVSRQLLQYAAREDVKFYVSGEILAETERVLNYERLRKRYPYYDEDIASFLQLIASIAQVVSPLSPVKGVVRDPNDDMILACAVEAQAQHIITRDKDLLILERFQDIEIASPEDYMAILRRGG
ncbi:MAG: putative toxin-antitoxin system toxin component, PIN family [Blastocatellales bacterium]